MRSKENTRISDRLFDKVANKLTKAAGSPAASLTAFFSIILWAIAGPIFDFSNTWQLFINTGTTIITFLMVFIIQQSQNKDTIAIHLKLNELIASNKNASNQLVDIEDLTEAELETVKRFYIKLADKAESEDDITKTHSLAEVEANQRQKKSTEKN